MMRKGWVVNINKEYICQTDTLLSNSNAFSDFVFTISGSYITHGSEMEMFILKVWQSHLLKEMFKLNFIDLLMFFKYIYFFVVSYDPNWYASVSPPFPKHDMNTYCHCI